MEQKQSSGATSLEHCWFSEVCTNLGPKCSQCQGKGLHYLAKTLFIPKSLIPADYLKSQLIKLDLTGPSITAERYVEQVHDLATKGKGMYAWSKNTGTGKTTTSIIALLRFLFFDLKSDPYDIDNRRILYINTNELLDRIRKSFSKPDDQLEQLLSEMSSLSTAPKLVLFDDIGTERCNEWVQERLYSLINYRVSNGLTSLFTSNYTIEELEGRLGSRIASRIIGCAKPVEFAGKDHRRCDW